HPITPLLPYTTLFRSPAMVAAHLDPMEPPQRPGPNDVMRLEDAIKYALESRPELRQLSLQLQNSQVEMQYNKNQLLPSLNVNATDRKSTRLNSSHQII